MWRLPVARFGGGLAPSDAPSRALAGGYAYSALPGAGRSAAFSMPRTYHLGEQSIANKQVNQTIAIEVFYVGRRCCSVHRRFYGHASTFAKALEDKETRPSHLRGTVPMAGQTLGPPVALVRFSRRAEARPLRH